MFKGFIVTYWAQLTVVLGVIASILKIVFDYKLKVKEQRAKNYYELKAKKIIEIYSKAVEIQMIIDRKKKGDAHSFEGNIFKNRISLDRYYWESSFYLTSKSENAFKDYLEWLKFFESKEMLQEEPLIEDKFFLVTKNLIAEFKKEVM